MIYKVVKIKIKDFKFFYFYNSLNSHNYEINRAYRDR